MPETRTLVLIPARMAATRLPGKPLLDIAGLPMIVHVLRRAEAAKIGRVAVATDTAEIADVVKSHGGEAVMTRTDHPSGSDRIYEALGKLDPGGEAEIVVNLQGDFPTIRPDNIRSVLAPLADPAVDIATLAAEIHTEEEYTNPNVVKAVGAMVAPGRLRALYFTRAAAPHGNGPHYHHIGLYAYRRAALERFVGSAPLAAGTAGETGAASRAGGRDADRHRRGRHGAARGRYAARSGNRPPHPGATGEKLAAATRRHEQDTPKTPAKTMKIAFQGEPGANSHIAVVNAYPGAEPMPCPTFEDALAAIASGEADLGMIPIENSVAGRVADIHHLLPQSGLFIVGEWFEPIHHQLMAPRGAKLADIKTVESHVQALGQCRRIIRKLGIKPIVAADTAGSARIVAERGDKSCASIASRLAAEIYGLDILAEDVEDETHNTTRFVVLAREAKWASAGIGTAGHHFCFPGPQPARRALQGDGRFRDQRRQHDQARKLHGRRQFLRHRNSMPTSTAIPRTRISPLRWRN